VDGRIWTSSLMDMDMDMDMVDLMLVGLNLLSHVRFFFFLLIFTSNEMCLLQLVFRSSELEEGVHANILFFFFEKNSMLLVKREKKKYLQ
jgi:hypothetical protein